MRAYMILKGKHECQDKIRWIKDIIFYKPFIVHTVSNKEESTNYSGYKLKKLKAYATKKVIFVRK